MYRESRQKTYVSSEHCVATRMCSELRGIRSAVQRFMHGPRTGLRIKVTLVGASWVVVTGVQTGCGLHSCEVFVETELPCARGRGPVWRGAGGRVPYRLRVVPRPSGAFILRGSGVDFYAL
eukprot:scaffold46347_cov68-Phaeocystis_antarctica.AAC.1